MFYHSVLHSSFKLESSLAGAPTINDQYNIAQRGQCAQPQVLHPFIRVIDQLHLQGSNRQTLNRGLEQTTTICI